MRTSPLDAVLAEGLARGIIGADQAAALCAIAREPIAEAIPSDDERLRLVTGFADIFVTLGIGLFLGATDWLASQSLPPVLTAALVSLLAWGLAEFFTRQRRMALPSIALLAAFAYAAFIGLLAALFGSRATGPLGLAVIGRGDVDAAARVALAALGTAALVALHYRRFRVPITVAAGLAALLVAGLTLVAALAPAFAKTNLSGLLIAAGLLTFAVAMRFDLADPGRTTRIADIAFWLHLLAAPLVVHPLMSGFADAGTAPTTASAAAVLAVFAALAVAALVVDRRAMLVSGLVYAGVAFGSLVRQAGVSDQTVPLTVLALGAFVLLISAGWRPLRRALLRLLPPGAAARLPHPQAIA